MDRLISQQAAIEAIVSQEAVYADDAIDILRSMPPAQPEIIRCKDCKYYKANKYDGKLACHYVIGGTVVRNLDDFCSRAERRTNEDD